MKAALAVAAAAMAVHGCGGKHALEDSGSASDVRPSATIVMNCADQALIDHGAYRAENNTWGKGALRGWSQCIGLATGTRGTLAGRWRWNWPNTDGHVTAYPEVIFGQKPGKTSTTASLPMKMNGLRAARVAYDVSSIHTGIGNTAFDIWLTNTGNPTAFSAPPITHEVMIWLESYGGMRPDGALVEQVVLDGALYHVHVADKVAHGGRYIAFVRMPSQLGAGTLDITVFLSHVRSMGLATGEEYVAAIEFGNEVITGTGETRLDAYAVSLE
jgi:Glycosyl hydrolase family 12